MRSLDSGVSSVMLMLMGVLRLLTGMGEPADDDKLSDTTPEWILHTHKHGQSLRPLLQPQSTYSTPVYA
jgi:hypothetical protein